MPPQFRERSTITTALLPVLGAPVAQSSLVDPQIPRHLRNRLPSLPDNPDRALPEVLIEPPPRLCHRPSSLAMSPRYEGKPTERRHRRVGLRPAPDTMA